jgi:hypothetical protein
MRSLGAELAAFEEREVQRLLLAAKITSQSLILNWTPLEKMMKTAISLGFGIGAAHAAT